MTPSSTSSKDAEVSIFGSSGFIGSRYILKSEMVTEAVPRNENRSTCKELLYLIGTVDNYNIWSNPLLDIETNLIKLVKVLCQNRDEFGKFTINYVSSWFVYGNGQSPSKEDMPCNPIGFYSITKFAAEKMVETFCKTFDCKYRIIRLSNVFGGADNKASSKKNVLQYFVKRIRNNEAIDLFDHGQMIRDFIHVDDVVRGLDTILQKAPLNEIYNLGSGRPTSLYDLLVSYRDFIGSSSEINRVPLPANQESFYLRECHLSIEKIAKLGFKPEKIIDSLQLDKL
jgi:nucleoside-diphosphate-sugar epimerase